MADPFAAALDAQFNAPGSAAAEYWPVSSDPITGIRVIRSRGDRAVRVGGDQVITDSEIVDVRISDVHAIGPGDRLKIGELSETGVFVPTEYLAISGEPVTDIEKLTWSVGAELIDPFE